MVDESSEDEFLSVQDAASYLGVTAQTLRRWDTSERLKPVRHPVNGYRYYRRSDLEPFKLDYSRAELLSESPSTGHLFQRAIANIESNERLREPQKQAHAAVREHFAHSRTPAILQIPVGCGKTGIMSTLPFGIANGRVLVITPNTTIRKGVSEALDISSSKCFWTRTRVLSNYTEGPFAALLDGPEANIHDCTESHFVVTNIQQLASSADRWLPKFPKNFFDMILVDEGHHAAATSWTKVFAQFPDAKIIGLTATPFRSDEKELNAEIIYRYSFARAMMNGYIKEIHSQNVAPSEIYFTYRGDAKRHSLDEVMKLREEQWFRKGVALAPECNLHIAEASIVRMRKLREKTGIKHQIIAVACSVDHARQVRSIYSELGLKAAEIYSEMEDEAKEQVFSDLSSGRLDCIVQVQMLGEGFDHPQLSVAAIFRPFRSLSPYIQFVGRIMRVIHEGEPGHPDNHGFVVSHIGLNNDARWDEFKELDVDDQAIIRRWLHESGDEPANEEATGNGRSRRFDLGMDVMDEVVSHFIEGSFLDPDDDRILDQLLSQRIGSGLTLGDIIPREEFRAKLKEKIGDIRSQQPQPLAAQPQKKRQEGRKRLNERAKAVANRVLSDLGLSRAGVDVLRTGLARGHNFAALVILLNKEVNKYLGIPSGSRADLSREQVEDAFSNLDSIGDSVREALRQRIGGDDAKG